MVSLKMKKSKKKIYRKPEDFYTEEDRKDAEKRQTINLSVNDFDARGHLNNPRAPCVVTTIDPDYLKDLRQPKRIKKFRMKSDILILREITRNKFTIYSTKQRFLERERNAENEEKIYQKMIDFNKFATEFLEKLKADAFVQMQETYLKLRKIRETRPKLERELKDVTNQYQRLLVETQDDYRTFLSGLKKISYFDNIEDEEALASRDVNIDAEKAKLIKPAEITNMEISEKHIAGKKEAKELELYMNQIVRPYLAEKRYLTPSIWINGYEKMRQKIFNFNSRVMNLGLLNLRVKMIHYKFKKQYDEAVESPIFAKDAALIQARADTLKQLTNIAVDNFDKAYKEDKMSLRLNAVVPVLLKSIEDTIRKDNKTKEVMDKPEVETETLPSDSCETEYPQIASLEQVQKIQEHLLLLLNKLDKYPPELVQKVEAEERRRIRMEKENSRRALAKENRMENWLDHFKKHAAQNNPN
ncbi:uncharacterized protein LOC119679419 [Teleopsis dalmanni]|uniref:uncharacterized protein LOC119679419 n=1 Tax=Teleopsis dalmanni TaxID=139649 RepID=UPI000D32C983|nr:uncharacterized protein LOC119679419 [Teleopsis dalmanni]